MIPARRMFLPLLSLLAVIYCPSIATAADRPNVIFVLVDDMGWMDLHCQGNERLDTPAIDHFADQGMRFTDAYAAAPVCSPTRAALMTGQSPARLHLTTHIPDRFVPDDGRPLPAETLNELPLEHVTIAERFKAAGYATAFMGKWHLSGRGAGSPEFYPEKQGFDVNLAGCGFGGPPGYFAPYRIHNLTSRTDDEYLPDRLVDEAMAFIGRHRDEPFMLCLWHYTVHWPMEAPEPLVEKYKERLGPGIKDPRYAGMIEALDSAFGRLMAELDRLRLTQNTLVVFTSDNGGYLGVADNRPLRLGKGYLYEGGIRVPLLVRWPGVITPGTTCSVPVVSTDFYPTLLEAAGLEFDREIPCDGQSLMPLLTGRGALEPRALFFHYPNYAWHKANRLGGAVRQGDYKLIENYDDGSVELYNLKEDIGETQDLSKKLPKKAAELKARLFVWLTETGAAMPKPAPN